MGLTSNSFFLAAYARINPAIFDALFPMNPDFSPSARDILAIMVLKAIPQAIIGPNNAHELTRVGKSLFDSSIKTMDYDDNNWCGNGRRPHPHFTPVSDPLLRFELNPQPEPPGDKIFYSGVIEMMADVVSSKQHAGELRTISAKIRESAITREATQAGARESHT